MDDDEGLRLTQPTVLLQCWEWNCTDQSTAWIWLDGQPVATVCPAHAAVAIELARKDGGFGHEWTISELRR